MALPWLIGAVAVAGVAYIASSSSSNNNDDDDYEERRARERARRRAREKEEKERNQMIEIFCEKWELDSFDSSFSDSKQIQKKEKKIQTIDNEINELKFLLQEVKIM